jgi:tetratricopeptide (TPR) repeat protein
MLKTNFTTLVLLFFTLFASAQFHTLNIPQSSPEVQESQKLGVTKITINYGSPSVKGRDVWNNPRIIPQQGNPIPWRAGANMNTTITFSTDVFIEGQKLKAGTYGFHIIPKGNTYTLLFAHNNNQWGSYYLDIDKDVTLSVEVTSEESSFSEQLDFEFLDRTENSLVIGLEWEKRRIPFKVEVDLNKTTVESFRSELRGINTYHWQAWNDAANWCLNHDTNLEEALEWVNRSINGGYGGFAADKNLSNLGTKIQLLKKLNKTTELEATKTEAMRLDVTKNEANGFGIFLMQNGFYQDAYDYNKTQFKQYPNAWFLQLNRGLSQYFLGNTKAAVKDIKKVLESAPEQYHNRLNEIINEVESGTYTL